MLSLKRSSEPILIIHSIFAALAGGGTAAAVADPAAHAPSLMKSLLPIGVSAGILALGWFNRRYVVPLAKWLQAEAAKAGVDVPIAAAVPVIEQAAIAAVSTAAHAAPPA